jgi:hypothetical protein
VNVETKEKSKQWKNTHSPNKLKKIKKTLSARKMMVTVFWDRKGMLVVKFMQQGTTISEVHGETLEKMHRTTHNKWPRMLTSGVVLLHDNACPHTTART